MICFLENTLTFAALTAALSYCISSASVVHVNQKNVHSTAISCDVLCSDTLSQGSHHIGSSLLPTIGCINQMS